MDTLDKQTVRAVIAHSPHEAVESDEALYLALPPEKREIILKRLAVIEPFLQNADRGWAEANAAAAELGMVGRNFYRLVARLKKFGAVRGLAPRYRNKLSSSPVSVGFSEAAEKEVRKYVSDTSDLSKPMLSLNDLTALIVEKAKAAGEEPPLARASSAASRRCAGRVCL
jgi:hypothetical protein